MKIKLYFLIAVILLFSSGKGMSQNRSNKKYTAIGIEVDVLPYLSGGYNGAVWIGYGPLRGKLSVANNTIPQMFVKTGFQDNTVTSYGFSGNYFLASNNFEKVWVGLDAEYWNGKVTSETTLQSADYTNYIIGLGLGYILKFYRNFYLNPSLGFRFIAAGDTQILVGDNNEEFSNPTVLPSISISLGWHYGIKQNAKWYMKSGKQPKKKRVRVIF